MWDRTGRLTSIAISRDGQTNRSVPRRRTGFQPVVAGPASAHCNRGIGILRREPAQRDRSTQRSSRGTCSTRERAASSGGPRRHSAGTGIAISVKKGHPQDARERRGWDSNPRCPFRHAGFQDRCRISVSANATQSYVKPQPPRCPQWCRPRRVPFWSLVFQQIWPALWLFGSVYRRPFGRGSWRWSIRQQISTRDPP